MAIKVQSVNRCVRTTAVESIGAIYCDDIDFAAGGPVPSKFNYFSGTSLKMYAAL